MHLNAADLGIVGCAIGELDHDLAAAVGCGGEGFCNGDVFSACCGEDVEVDQHLIAIDDDVELIQKLIFLDCPPWIRASLREDRFNPLAHFIQRCLFVQSKGVRPYQDSLELIKTGQRGDERDKFLG